VIEIIPVSLGEYTIRRHFEWQIFRVRWLTLPLAFALVTALRSPPLWFSLLALSGYLLHNLARAHLLADGTVGQLRLFGGVLLLVDLGVVLLALAPMILAGTIVLKVLLFALLLEVALRLRLERPRISVPVMGVTTLILALYAYRLDARVPESPENVAVWVGLLGVAGIAGVCFAWGQWRVINAGWQAAPPSVSLVPSVAVTPCFRVPAPSHGLNPLTPRQRQILQSVDAGMTNAQIAREMGRGVETIRTHLQLIYRLLDVHDRAAAAQGARERGWLDET